jgi:hypothetical protein
MAAPAAQAIAAARLCHRRGRASIGGMHAAGADASAMGVATAVADPKSGAEAFPASN